MIRLSPTEAKSSRTCLTKFMKWAKKHQYCDLTFPKITKFVVVRYERGEAFLCSDLATESSTLVKLRWFSHGKTTLSLKNQTRLLDLTTGEDLYLDGDTKN